MSIITTIVIGLVAKLLMPGKDPGGFIMTTLLGVAGAVMATFFGQILGLYPDDQSAGFIGAVLLLLLYRAIVGKKHTVYTVRKS
ncbi:MAG: GlsB/YeaQ/YmgE family stress response membrane protein [candidate division Zixibacteria bacterium]|nr:GlsB/YeaQ/YmgE family stress response membrane protein [candidate division Zixibacteria bacterium]